MKISVILAHPDKKSFNHAIALTAVTNFFDAGTVLPSPEVYQLFHKMS
jgi:putative NADPH-quinone reductase